MGRLGFATATIFVALQVVLSTALTARAQLAVGQEGTSGGPRVVLGSDPKTSQRYVQVTGRGAPVYPTVDIACDGIRWTMPLTRSEDGAIYAISRNLVETMLNAVECRLFLPDQEITLTRTQLWAVWGSAATRAAGAPQILVGQVVEVIDGNTILVNLGNRAETVRYIGINPQEANRSPRSVEPVVGEAAEANRQLVGRQQIRLELDAQERDREGRLLAYVYVADRMVNAELVRRGAAEVMTVQPNVRYREVFVTAEQEARDQRRGLWADPSEPTTPSAVEQTARPGAEGRTGVPPDGVWACPVPQLIKGQITASTGGRCVYHLPDGAFYSTVKPERCYATIEDARHDGCVASRR